MGLGYKEAVPLLNTLKELDGKENISFLELGNNYMRGDETINWVKSLDLDIPLGGQQHKNGFVTKYFWTKIGFNHTSIDMNGLDGSLNLDLRKDLSEVFPEKFDFVYDGGTGEHVDNQYMCFKNVHNFTKPGGLMCHVLPKVGTVPGHCQYYYTLESFKVLAEICEYEVKELCEHEAVAGAMIYATLRKKDNDFISEEEFKKVPIHYVEGQSNDKALYPYAYK